MNKDALQKIHSAACGVRSRYRCSTGRIITAFQHGELTEAQAWAAIARAERSLQQEYARLVRQASELPIYRQQIENIQGIRRVPRVLPGAWAGEDPARLALYQIARLAAEELNAALEGADASVLCYPGEFLVVEWLRDGEPVACAIAHDQWRLAWL